MAQINWTGPALTDLEGIASYIALDKPNAAQSLVRCVFKRVEQLGEFPLSGSKSRELRGTPYRQLVIPTLKLYYRVDAGNVYVVCVMRSERQFRLQNVQERDG